LVEKLNSPPIMYTIVDTEYKFMNLILYNA